MLWEYLVVAGPSIKSLYNAVSPPLCEGAPVPGSSILLDNPRQSSLILFSPLCKEGYYET